MEVFKVVIPYFHEFEIEANNKKEAIKKAIESGVGSIISRDDERIEVWEKGE